MNKIILTIFLIIILAASANAKTDNHMKRVLAHSDAQVASAVKDGCLRVLQTQGLTALNCMPQTAAKLGLQDDVKVYAVDTAANAQIQATRVQSIGNKGAGQKIVILDTGYNYNHPELKSSYLGGWDFVNNDSDPMDDNGHGSHVAGLITGDGVMNGALGVAPSTGIISGKVLDASGTGYFSDVIAGIYWAVNGPDGKFGTKDDFKPAAISLSLGTSPPYTYSAYCDDVMPDMTAAINYARSKNVLVVVAAGNSGSSGVGLPGCITNATTVAAVDASNKTASFSGVGKAVDIAAPGVGLFSAWLGTDYMYASGTSMATPMVTGTIALIKAKHPNYTATQVENALFNTAKDLGQKGKDKYYGYGLVNAYLAAR